MNILPLCLSLISFLTGADKAGELVSAELVFVGDAMTHQAQIDHALSEGNNLRYDFDDCFSLIAPTIVAADYAVCNLETPLGGGPRYTGFPCFSAPDSYAEALKSAGFDMFLTANNHSLDRLDRGIRRTIDVLDSMDVDHIGTYHNARQRNELVPFIKTINGIRIGFLNYTYGTNGLEAKDGAEVSLIEKDKIADEIARTRQAGAEILCVCIHWGIEYVLLENTYQRDMADFLVRQGVDLIIGGHPHVIQPMKVVRNEKENKDVLIVYSLGNFISNMKTGDTRGGALVKCKISRDKNGKARFQSAVYDTFFAAKPMGRGTNFRVIPSRWSDLIPPSQLGHWHIFNNAAQRIFDTHNIGVKREK